MKIVFVYLDPKLPWRRTPVKMPQWRLKEFRSNPDQIYIRSYWKRFVNALSAEFTSRGHSVKLKKMSRWDVKAETIARLESDLVYIPHTSAHLFPYNKPAFYYMQVMQAWLFSADQSGWSSKSSKYPAVEYIKGDPNSGVFERYKKLIVKKNASKFRQKRSLPYFLLALKRDVPAFKEYIFFPCQIPHDESILYNSDVEEIDVVKALADWANANQVYVVFKRHPANLKSMEPLEKAATGEYVYWTNASIHDLVKRAKAVYTINSGVGFESMLHEKPVITFGKIEYDAVTIKANLNNLDEVWEKIKIWDKVKEVENYKRFFDWFCRLYCVDLDEPINRQARVKEMCDEAEEYVKNFVMPPKEKFDFICLTNKGTADWILGAISREIATHIKAKAEVVIHGEHEVLEAETYFFSNWYTYVEQFYKKTLPKVGKKLVYFTHPREVSRSEQKIIISFNKADKIIFMCSSTMNDFIKKGLDPERAVTIPGAADPEFFYNHERSGEGAVGFCSAYYERKNPELIHNIIKAMPHRKFMLLGKKWEEYENFAKMKSLPNFTYIDDKYENYPGYYNQMDVFVSAAKLEGGPIPLVEAMMSNVFPVASITGFAPDIIEHGKNGFLFDTEKTELKDLCLLIDKAFDDKVTDIRATTSKLTWEHFAANVLAQSKQ